MSNEPSFVYNRINCRKSGPTICKQQQHGCVTPKKNWTTIFVSVEVFYLFSITGDSSLKGKVDGSEMVTFPTSPCLSHRIWNTWLVREGGQTQIEAGAHFSSWFSELIGIWFSLSRWQFVCSSNALSRSTQFCRLLNLERLSYFWACKFDLFSTLTCLASVLGATLTHIPLKRRSIN